MTVRRLSGSLLLALAGLAVAGALAEAAVRLFAHTSDSYLAFRIRQRDPYQVKIEPHGTLGYRPRPGSTFHYSTGSVATVNAMGFRGAVVSRSRPPKVFRIVLLGGSTTHGWGVGDDETIDVYLKTLLRQRHPDREFDVINLAFDGYDAYQIYERLRSDGIPLAPDLAIVNSGVNDVRNARFPNLRDRDPRTLIWEPDVARLRDEARRGGPRLWTRVKHMSYLARLPGILRDDTRRPAPASTSSGEPTPNPQAYDYFERNLGRIAELTQAQNIPLILSTPPSSLAGRYAPTATSTRDYWIGTAATTQAVRDTLARRMEQLAARLAGEDRAVSYVAIDLPASVFLDDAHLSAAGNRAVAERFADAVAPYIRGVRGEGRVRGSPSRAAARGAPPPRPAP